MDFKKYQTFIYHCLFDGNISTQFGNNINSSLESFIDFISNDEIKDILIHSRNIYNHVYNKINSSDYSLSKNKNEIIDKVFVDLIESHNLLFIPQGTIKHLIGSIFL